MDALLQIRSRISQAVEKPQKAGEIGSALEAKIQLGATPEELKSLAPVQSEAEEIFILSDLQISESATPTCGVSKTSYLRCERCWRHRPEVGQSAAHQTLCGRCEGALG
jgi:isoleucyl-tRNA synthetase